MPDHNGADALPPSALFACSFALFAMEDISYYSSDNDIDDENEEEDDESDEGFEKALLGMSSASKTYLVRTTH